MSWETSVKLPYNINRQGRRLQLPEVLYKLTWEECICCSFSFFILFMFSLFMFLQVTRCICSIWTLVTWVSNTLMLNFFMLLQVSQFTSRIFTLITEVSWSHGYFVRSSWYYAPLIPASSTIDPEIYLYTVHVKYRREILYIWCKKWMSWVQFWWRHAARIDHRSCLSNNGYIYW